MNDTAKILRELSSLTSNMDVLAKELRESNIIGKDTNKELASLTKETKSSEPRINSQEKVGEEKNFKNFSESILNAFTKQNEGFLGNLEKTFKSGFPDSTKVGVNPAGVENQTQAKPGLVTKDLISAVAGRLANIPKLQDGGKIDAGGVALVGEKGPELVELQKGNVVNSQDKIAELLKMEMDDLKKSKETPASVESNKSQEASKIVSGGSKLDESVTNSFGVKVPKSEIDAYRKEIYDEFKKDFDEEPSLLEDEMKQFIEGYRETMSVSDIQKLSEKNQPKEIKKSEDELIKATDSKSKKNKLSELKKTGDEGKKLKGNESEKEKTKLQEMLSLSKFNPLKVAKDEAMKFAQKPNPQNLLSKEDMELEKSPTGNVSAKDIQALTERLKQGSSLNKEAQTLKPGDKKSSPAPTAQVNQITTPAKKEEVGTKTESQISKPEKMVQNTSTPEISENDIKEIKALLAGIYKSLNSPLSIVTDRPYRPNSNTF
jgi:hypothetical protein